jgi:hypothetical protein
MSLYRAFGGLTTRTPTVPNIASQISSMDRTAIKELDKFLLSASKNPQLGEGVGLKTMGTYNKLWSMPSYAAGTALWGKGFDVPKLLGMGAGVYGLARYGSHNARPLYEHFTQAAKKINPDVFNSLVKPTSVDSTLHIAQPGVALSSLPATLFDKYIAGGALNAAAHPYLSSSLTPIVLAGSVAGGAAIARRLATARRINQLKKGIAPKKYRDLATQIGFK